MRPAAARARAPAWRVETIHEASSTNDLVLERARKGEAAGLVVRAISQTRGRGRRGRAWFSPPGGLYFSALLRPERRTEAPQALTLLLGVAAAEGIGEAAGLRVGLKWPNDLRIGGKKIGGILCECEARPGAPAAVAAGVGVNLAAGEADFPPELRGAASSLLLAGGRVPDPARLLRALLERVASRLEEYEAEGFAPARSRWLGLCDHLGERVSVRLPNGRTSGTAKGVDGAGRLLLETAGGAIERVDAGEVEGA